MPCLRYKSDPNYKPGTSNAYILDKFAISAKFSWFHEYIKSSKSSVLTKAGSWIQARSSVKAGGKSNLC